MALVSSLSLLFLSCLGVSEFMGVVSRFIKSQSILQVRIWMEFFAYTGFYFVLFGCLFIYLFSLLFLRGWGKGESEQLGLRVYHLQ